MQTKERIFQTKLIAIMRGIPEEKLCDTAMALVKGGVSVMEITYDHSREDCMEAHKRALKILRDIPGISYGSGTVLTLDEAKLSLDEGAQIIISPHTDPRIIGFARENGMVACPGAMTPTEIVTAWDAGADFVKIFPAEQLGPGYIKAVKAPLKHIPMLAVGGADENNAGDFIKAGACGIGVGGKLVKSAYIQNSDWDSLTKLAQAFTQALK